MATGPQPPDWCGACGCPDLSFRAQGFQCLHCTCFHSPKEGTGYESEIRRLRAMVLTSYITIVENDLIVPGSSDRFDDAVDRWNRRRTKGPRRSIYRDANSRIGQLLRQWAEGIESGRIE